MKRTCQDKVPIGKPARGTGQQHELKVPAVPVRVMEQCLQLNVASISHRDLRSTADVVACY